MKERLVELLRDAELAHLDDIIMRPHTVSSNDFLADYLLKNGVIVPPCNIGQTVYRIWCGEIEEYEVIEYRYDGQRLWFFSYNDEYDLHQRRYIFSKNEIGKIVFLTREEAEAKLKEGGQR